jgi:hypothetical protein
MIRQNSEAIAGVPKRKGGTAGVILEPFRLPNNKIERQLS